MQKCKIKYNVEKERPGLFLLFIMQFWKPKWGDKRLSKELVAAQRLGGSQQCAQAPLTCVTSASGAASLALHLRQGVAAPPPPLLPSRAVRTVVL